MFSNKQKAIIVFSMLGEVYSDNILRKLSEDVFNKVQEEIFPFIGQIPLPDDIDSFVLENIIKEDESLGFDEKKEAEEIKINILDLQDDDFLSQVDVDVVISLLKLEKPIFQSFLLQFFKEEQRKIIEEDLKKDGVTLRKDFQKTAILEGVEGKVKKEFINKLKAQIKTENKE